MPFPATVRVKISSEAAEAISLTPVVVQEMPGAEFLELLLGLAGKDTARIHDLLMRGTAVAGASRFRWDPWSCDTVDLTAALQAFPDPDPTLPFRSAQCVRVVLHGGRVNIDVPREIGERKRLLKRRSLWDELMNVAERTRPDYTAYSYRDRADRYRLQLATADIESIRAAADLSAYSSVAATLRSVPIESMELYVTR
jgi:hypothetical protein